MNAQRLLITVIAFAACRSGQGAAPAPAAPPPAPDATPPPIAADAQTVATPDGPTASLPPADWRACTQRLRAAADEFRRRAPATYPPYRSLEWRAAAADAVDDGGPPEVQITPGRTWRFVAGITTKADPGDLAIDVPFESTSEAWAALPDHDHLAVRRSGDLLLVIYAETERSAVDPISDHPLVVDFTRRMKRALDDCAKHVE